MATKGASVRRRAGALLVAAGTALVVVTGCVADPPPPTVVGGEDNTADGADVSLTAGGLLLTLDRVDEGFNPHLLADQGVDTDLVASLLLPSAFVPGPTGDPVLNRDLLVSAAPLPDAPATIRYTIDPQAQWSDGVPVAAEDFEYLWRQMTTQPGVVDPAGYEQIVAVRSGAGGKVVDVVFDTEPTHWRTLFSNLLPAHILKDAPDGFEGAMSGIPVMSAGPYMIRAADLGRGEIEFVPNDRYWSRAPEIGQIVARRATGPGQLGAALRDGPGVVALVADTPVAADVSEAVPGVTTSTVEATIQLELGFNTVAPAVSDPRVRRALAAAMVPQAVGRIVTGEATPGVTSYPFPAGVGTTPTDDAELTHSELTAAGYTRVEGEWRRGDDPLTVTLGVEAADDRARTAAYTVADQLHGAGIGAHVWELEPTALYADALPHGLVDAVVGWQTVQGQPELSAVSRFACADDTTSSTATTSEPTRSRTTVSSLTPPDSSRPVPPQSPIRQTTGVDDRTSSAETDPTTVPTTPPRTLGTTAPARAADVAGICDPRIDAALGLGEDAGPVNLEEAGILVVEQALRVPLVRPTLLLADDGVDLTGGSTEDGSVSESPRTVTELFDTAPTWRRPG